MGTGSGIGLNMVESENSPIQITVDDGNVSKLKDFHTGMNTMLMQDEEGKIYKAGLKLDYSPKEVKLPEEFKGEDPLSGVTGMTCGRKHYVLWNGHN